MGRRAEKEFEEWALDAEAYTIEDVAKRAADKALYAQDAVAETPDQGTISGRLPGRVRRGVSGCVVGGALDPAENGSFLCLELFLSQHTGFF